MTIDGEVRAALIDTGCSLTLLGEKAAGNLSRDKCAMKLEMMNGAALVTGGAVRLNSVVTDGKVELGPLVAHVVPRLPLQVDIVLGLDILSRHGFELRQGSSEIVFGGPSTGGGATAAVQSLSVESKTNGVEDKDFCAKFEQGKWTASWKWKNVQQGAPVLNSRPCPNYVEESDRELFDEEIQSWVDSGVLVKHDMQTHGEVQNFLSLMAVRQEKGDKLKVRPVLDFRSLNNEVESHPGGAIPLCAERLRQWRQLGPNCSVLDLKKAYLQVHMDPELWTYQAVVWNGEVYLLTRLGFGLASAPKLMTAIVEKVLSQNPRISAAVTSYIDDLFITEDTVRASEVKSYLSQWGLDAKEPECLNSPDDVRVLGLRVDAQLNWSRDGKANTTVKNPLTRRQVHRLLGEWLGHYPVAGWLRVACSYIQRLTAQEKVSWDESVSREVLGLVQEIADRLKAGDDPVRGQWCVNRDSPVKVWADASNIAVGAALEVDGDIVEDAAWLRGKQDTAHINRAELDAVLRGINMAVKWGRKKLCVMTDSATVHGWLTAVVEKTHNVKTRALSEILIRRRLDTLREIIDEQSLNITVQLVRSAENRADLLTRVPSHWLKMRTDVLVGMSVSADADVNSVEPIEVIKEIHERSHFGVDRTLELARDRCGEGVSRKMVKRVVNRCDRCARVDPAARFSWMEGSTVTLKTWQRLAIDVTYVNQLPYLSLVDTASRFVIFKPLRNESGKEIAEQLRQIFCEFGPPEAILSDNASSFRGREVQSLLLDWKINHELSCAYRSRGNAVVERSHRTIKRGAKRGGRTVEEAVFWYNVTRGHHESSPYESVFAAKSRKPWSGSIRTEVERSPPAVRQSATSVLDDCYHDLDRNPFVEGDQVYLRDPLGRCDTEWSGPHRVTEVRSGVSVVINDDGVSRHVSHLRFVPGKHPLRDSYEDVVLDTGSSEQRDSEEENVNNVIHEDSDNTNAVAVRRSDRSRRLPCWSSDYVLY